MKTVIIVCLVVLVAVALFAAYKWSMHTIEKMEDAPSVTPAKPVARFFSMDGCPHCTTFDPEWTDFCGKKGVTGEKHVYYRSDKKNDEMVQQYVTKEDAVVSAFPTVLFIDESGNHTKYDGDRTSDDLYKHWTEWLGAKQSKSESA